jgi:hypothetical protein
MARTALLLLFCLWSLMSLLVCHQNFEHRLWKVWRTSWVHCNTQ